MYKVEQERQRQMMLILAAVGMMAGLGFYAAGNEEPTEEPEPVAAEPAASLGEKGSADWRRPMDRHRFGIPFRRGMRQLEKRRERRNPHRIRNLRLRGRKVYCQFLLPVRLCGQPNLRKPVWLQRKTRSGTQPEGDRSRF